MGKHLDERVLLKHSDRLVDPVRTGERHISVDPGDILPIARKSANCDIDQIFLVPELVTGSELKVKWIGTFCN
jgi:hypothetical protein